MPKRVFRMITLTGAMLLVGLGFYNGCKTIAQDSCELGVLAFMSQARPDIYMKLEDMGATDKMLKEYCEQVIGFNQ